MKTNVGPIDRLIRIILGLVIAAIGVYFKSYWGVVGIVILATGIFGYCLFYSLLSINSAGKKS